MTECTVADLPNGPGPPKDFDEAMQAPPAIDIMVHLASMNVSNDPTACLAAVELGSNMAVVVYDPKVSAGGILNFMLPKLELSQKQALANPAIFAESGIPQLYQRCYKFGASKERMLCYLIGAGNVMDESSSFHPGSDNLEMARRILEKNGVEIREEWVGGHSRRSVRLQISDGQISVQSSDDDENQS